MVTKTLTAAGPEKDNKIIEKIVTDQRSEITKIISILFTSPFVPGKLS